MLRIVELRVAARNNSHLLPHLDRDMLRVRGLVLSLGLLPCRIVSAGPSAAFLEPTETRKIPGTLVLNQA